MGNLEINNLRQSMQTFEDSHKDYKAFKEKSNKVCYIPQNADDFDDCFTYEMLVEECKNYLKKSEIDFFNELDHYSELLAKLVFNHLSWEFPSTYLVELEFESVEELKEILNNI